MEEKNTMPHNTEVQEASTPAEERQAARRKLIKAGIMSVPVIMTVHSRPLFAQTNGSVGALGYGGYNSQTTSDFVMPSENGTIEPERSSPYGQSFDLSDQFGGYNYNSSGSLRDRFNRDR